MKKQTIIAPEDGWKPNSLYLVDVSYNPNNPVHRSYLYTGFLNGKDGGPGGYHSIWNASYDPLKIEDAYFLRAVRLISENELVGGECRLPDDVIAEIEHFKVAEWECDKCGTTNGPVEKLCHQCEEPRND